MWDKGPLGEMLQTLIRSFEEEGIKYPLCCSNVKDDGTYCVNSGCCRLEAAKRLGMSGLPCLVACEELQSRIPAGHRIESYEELDRLFRNQVETVHWEKNCFDVRYRGVWEPSHSPDTWVV